MTRFPRIKRWLKYRFYPRALILMYHRVAELPNDPHLLAVTPQHFAEQLETIRKYANPIRLQQLVESLRRGVVPQRAVVITFDDGYADNLHQAKPILENYQIPATVFVTAGMVGGQQEFWWDELDRLLLQPGRLPNQLRLALEGDNYAWESDQGGVYTEQAYQHNRSWHIESDANPHPRHQLFHELFARLLAMPDAQRQKILADLREWASIEPDARPTHRTMTSAELQLLVQNRLIEVGAHTMTHPRLAALDEAQQSSEISQSKVCLEALINRPVTSFAYPGGSTTQQSSAILQESGFRAACTSNADAVWKGADIFHLPRLGVRDWDKASFTNWFQYWMNG